MNERRLVDAASLAKLIGVSRDFVYSHADELGTIRLGSGPKARLRFDPDWALEDAVARAPRGAEARAAPLGRVAHLIVPKDENAGYRPAQTQIVRTRRDGSLRRSVIADGSRLMRKPETWDSSVELDALDPDMLRRIVSEGIISHVDLNAWRMQQIVEEQERQLLVRPAWGVES